MNPDSNLPPIVPGKPEVAVATVVLAILSPPTITYIVSSRLTEYGLDVFSVLLIEALGFAAGVLIVRPRAWNAVLAGLLYFTSMTIVIFLIGIRAGYYDWP